MSTSTSPAIQGYKCEAGEVVRDNTTTEDVCSSLGLLLPILNESAWSWPLRATLYMLGLLWCFLGVAIIADIFMCAIEKITSHTRKIKVASEESSSGYETIEVKIWNGTVANLTLMALGSSAPEILLSCIEIVGKGFEAGDLGPGTIVGSAAFNLFCITAVCVMAVPGNEIRRVNKFKVFLVTSVLSLFAYAWLVVTLIVVTPDEMDLWEALLTFAFFPMLVIFAYVTDRNCFCPKITSEAAEGEALNHSNKLSNFLPWNRNKRKKHSMDVTESGIDIDQMKSIIKELRAIYPEMSEEEIAELATARISEEKPRDRLWYRINAVKQLGGNPKLTPKVTCKLEKVYGILKKGEGGMSNLKLEEENLTCSAVDVDGMRKAVVEFTTTQAAILEREQKVTVCIKRSGRITSPVACKIETIEGSAEANKDYIPINQTLTFAPNETKKTLDITVIDDNEWEPDEVFFVKLSLDPDNPDSRLVMLGKRAIQEITILNDDDPGTFSFEKPSILVKESDGTAQIPIVRADGADGKVVVTWKTEDLTAICGRDYEGGEGTVTFEHGEVNKVLEIPIKDDQEKEKNESFKVDLVATDCEGAKLGRVRKTIVTIVDDDEFNSMANRLMMTVNMNVDAMRVDASTWADQFRNAMNVNGGDLDNASTIDYVMHFLTFGWKLIFAFVPPPHFLNGWVAFFVSLLLIGLLTAIVGDLAAIFGCVVGLKDSVTSITFVALGTSLPDLFASKQAATMDKYADNAIGNVMGSNCVNVFLGLGLPWSIAAIYWATQNKTFKVPVGSLGFSVVVYLAAASVCMVVLILRRFIPALGRGELGGPTVPKYCTAILFLVLWLAYIILSSLQAYGHM